MHAFLISASLSQFRPSRKGRFGQFHQRYVRRRRLIRDLAGGTCEHLALFIASHVIARVFLPHAAP
jgi:hypothetical protein